MSRERLTDEQVYVERVPAVMEALARPHTEVAGTRLRLLDYNPDDPAQDPLLHRFLGNRADVDIAVVDVVAENAEPRFRSMMDVLRSDEQAQSVTTVTADSLREKKNVWVISPHGDILDIAFILKATYNLLHEQGYTPRRIISILSKMLTRVGFELIPDQDPVPTVPTFGMQCDDVFLTHPRTKSARKALKQLPKSIVDRENQIVSDEIDREFEEGDVLAAMAPTGTTRMKRTRTLPRRTRPWRRSESGALILPAPSKGTLQLMMKENTLVLPVPAWFKGEEIKIAMPTDPIEISDEAKVHEMLTYMAEVLSEIVEEENFTYKIPRRRLGRSALGHHGE